MMGKIIQLQILLFCLVVIFACSSKSESDSHSGDGDCDLDNENFREEIPEVDTELNEIDLLEQDLELGADFDKEDFDIEAIENEIEKQDIDEESGDYIEENPEDPGVPLAPGPWEELTPECAEFLRVACGCNSYMLFPYLPLYTCNDALAIAERFDNPKLCKALSDSIISFLRIQVYQCYKYPGKKGKSITDECTGPIHALACVGGWDEDLFGEKPQDHQSYSMFATCDYDEPDFECPEDMVPLGTSGVCMDIYLNSRQDADADDAGTDDTSPPESVNGVLPWQHKDGVRGALLACESAGKRLCTGEEMAIACRGPKCLVYPHGIPVENVEEDYESHLKCANFDEEINACYLQTGANDACVSGFRVHDLLISYDEYTGERYTEGCESDLCLNYKKRIGECRNSHLYPNSCLGLAIPDMKSKAADSKGKSIDQRTGFRCCKTVR